MVRDAPAWEVEGAAWPNRSASRFPTAAGLHWHVQCAGSDGAPVALLLHGAGAATHSWRDLLPELARDFRVVAPDLPGHGFSGWGPRAASTLPGMARAVAELLAELGVRPDLLVAHSAGAAVAAQMVLDRHVAPRGLVSLNGAFAPMSGAGILAPVSRLLASPVAARLAVARARRPGVVAKLLRWMGSDIDPLGLSAYEGLMARTAHVGGTLRMMADWDLAGLAPRLASLAVPVLAVHGTADRALDGAYRERVRRLLPGLEHQPLEGLGHLAHEEAPAEVAALVRRFWARRACGACGRP